VHDAQPLRKGNSMPRQSASGKFVEISADEVPARTPRDMARLKAAMDLPVEPSEDLESNQLGGPEVRRDASGQILKRPLGQLRAAILASLDHHQMTRYELWKKAHALCDSLSASAVYEYLRGDRELGSEYMEALIEAARLKVVNQDGSRAKKPAADAQIKEPLKKIVQSAPRLKKGSDDHRNKKTPVSRSGQPGNSDRKVFHHCSDDRRTPTVNRRRIQERLAARSPLHLGGMGSSQKPRRSKTQSGRLIARGWVEQTLILRPLHSCISRYSSMRRSFLTSLIQICPANR
jgi:hypothetical protein